MKGIIKPFPVDELRERLTPLFRERGLQLVYLFGSAASGKFRRQSSDLDLAFLFDLPVDILDLTNKVTRLLQTDRVDVVDLRSSSPLLKFSSIKNGKIIFERVPGLFNVYYSLFFRMYVDTKKLREAQARVINNYLEIRGYK